MTDDELDTEQYFDQYEAVLQWRRMQTDKNTKQAFVQCGFAENFLHLIDNVTGSLRSLNKEKVVRNEEHVEKLLRKNEKLRDSKAFSEIIEAHRTSMSDFSYKLEKLFAAPCPPEIKNAQSYLSEEIHNTVQFILEEKGYVTEGVINRVKKQLEGYFDSCDPCSEQYDIAVSNRYELLNDIIGNILEANRNHTITQAESSYPRFDYDDFKWAVVENAKKYIDEPLMHSPSITSLIATAVLNTEIYPLENSLKGYSNDLRHDNSNYRDLYLTSRYCTDFFDRDIIVAALITGSVKLVGDYFEIFWLSFPVIGIFLVFAFLRFFKRGEFLNIKGRITNLLNIHKDLVLVSNEISYGSYDADRITERLKKIEVDGAYFPSIVYSLLKLH